jgi:hypothetical protein
MGQPLAEHHGAHTHRMAGVAIVATRAQMGSVGVGGPTAIVTVTQPADGVPEPEAERWIQCIILSLHFSQSSLRAASSATK